MSFNLKMLGILAVAALPTLSFAGDLSVTNNSNSPVTGHMLVFCSSIVSEGILLPHAPAYVVPQNYMDKLGFICPHGCDVDIYASNSCKGEKIATIAISKQKGISDVRNTYHDGYYVAGEGFDISIEGGPSLMKRIYNYFIS